MPCLWSDPYPEFFLYPIRKLLSKKQRKPVALSNNRKISLYLSLAFIFLAVDIVIKSISRGSIDVLADFFNPFYSFPYGEEMFGLGDFFTQNEIASLGADNYSTVIIAHMLLSLNLSLLVLNILKFYLYDDDGRFFTLSGFCFGIMGLCAASCMESVCGVAIRLLALNIPSMADSAIIWNIILGFTLNFLMYIVIDDIAEFIFSIFAAPLFVKLISLIPSVEYDLSDMGVLTLAICIVFTYVLKFIFYLLKKSGLLNRLTNFIKKWCYTLKYALFFGLFLIYWLFTLVFSSAKKKS